MSNTQGRRLSRRLALAAALAAAVLRQVSGAASIKTGAPEGQAGSAVNGVIPILGNAVQTTLLGQGGGLSLQLAPSAGVSQAPPVLPLPAAVLGANANANLAYLLQQTAPGPAFAQPAMPEALPAVKPAADASASALEAAGTKAPQPSAETALRQLKAAEQVLGRFEPGEFRKLPPAQLQAVLSELWDGVRHVSAEAQAPAGASEGNLQSGNRRAIRLERGGQAARFKNLLLEGVSPEMPQVAQGELRYWEPEEKAIETHVAGPHDSPALAAALAENEAAALRSIWARVAEGAALTPSVRAQADWLVAEAAREVIRQGRKGWALLGPALQASASDAAPDLQAAARALRESLLPALAEPDELVYLIEERQGSVTREELRRALIQREKDLVMDGIFDRILRFPYGFDVETPKEAQGQQVIAAARRSMMQSQWDDILAGIEQGLPARRAVAPVLDSLGKLVAQTEAKVLKNPTNSLMRNNLTVFQEIASAFSALIAALNSGAGRRYVARLTIGVVLLLGLWADVQWFYRPEYRKADSRATAQWLAANQTSVKSWTVLPEYLSESIEWYLQANQEVIAHRQPPTEAQTTTFPPVPDALIIGRRHHITEPDKIIAAYRLSAGSVRTIPGIAGFEIYVRNK